MTTGPIRYDEQLEQLGFPVTARGIWALVGSSPVEFGWKLHLSSFGRLAPDLVRAVAPILATTKCPFKVARDSDILGMLNEGTFGATQVGKFATVYPQTSEESRRIAEELVSATESFVGPRVVTDMFLGGVIYARFGSHSPRMVRDRLGLFEALDQPPAAQYSVPFIPPVELDNPFIGLQKEATSAAVGLRLIGPGYLISKVIQVHAKGSVFEAIDLRNQHVVDRVILKEARPYVMSDIYGRDMKDRLRNETAALAALSGKAPVPASGPLFEHADNLYLPIQLVIGRDFGARATTPYMALTRPEQIQLLSELAKIAAAVAAVHRAGFVHRDLSMRNIRFTPEDTVQLIDLEIAYRVGCGSVPFSQGTAGFVSPQQLVNDEPMFTDDLYSLGAVIVCAITGCDPQRVLHGTHADSYEKIRLLSGAPEWLCRLAADCVAPDPSGRPHIESVGAILKDPPGALATEGAKGFPLGDNYANFVNDGLKWLLDGAPRDDGLWLSPDLASSEHGSLRLIQGFRVYRSTSRGVAGVLYTLCKLHRYGFVQPGSATQAGEAVDWLLEHRPTPDDQMVGLHFGEAGVAVAIAEAIASGLVETGPWLDPYMSEALCGPIDWPDLTHGAAGQGFAAFMCADLLSKPELGNLANRCAEYLVTSQEKDGSWVLPAGVRAMEGGTYTGFAHGVAGIVSFLAYHASRTNDQASRAAALHGGEWLMLQARSGRAAASLWWTLNTSTDETWRWWCHGGPGIALGLLDLFVLTQDEMWSASVRACLRAHPVHLRYPNLSQCHGMSGLGDILLEAYRVLGEVEWLDRARAIGVAMAGLAGRSVDGASWMVENPYRPTPDLMIGTSGVLHFLARLTAHDNPTFGLPLKPPVIAP
jgi:tRNA A-37 threonylcarbamoyl transferase component Bud32